MTTHSPSRIAARTVSLFEVHRDLVAKRTSHLFAWLMLGQWIFAVGIALWWSPYAWAGNVRTVHVHVYASLALGAALSSAPIALAILQPSASVTRYSIAVAQMLWSALLIHLTGGRIETHFHVFGSLAFLAFYRDWRVLVPATIVVTADHFLRGVFWPESVYGIANPEWWRFLEHGFWVGYIDVFLVIACVQSSKEMHEVSERQAEVELLSESLEEKKTLLASQSEASSEGILLVDSTGIAVSFNRRFLELWGIEAPAAERPVDAVLLGQALSKVADQPAFVERVKALYADPDAEATDEVPLIDGRVFQRFTAPVRTEDGRRIGRGWYFRDITQAKHAERAIRDMNAELERRVEERTGALATANAELESSFAELRSAQQKLILADRLMAVGRLSAGIAHEINNPLAYVTSNLDFIAEQLPTSMPDDALAEVRLAIHDAKQGSDRVRRIVGDLKMFARVDDDRRDAVDVAEVLETSLKMVANEMRHRGKLVREYGETPRVLADGGRLGQVFLNLLINAAQALPEGRPDDNEIRVRTGTAPDGRVSVEIHDTGSGIPAEIRDRLFDPFFTTKPIGVGTGLGLSICHGIVAALGGQILVESKPGHGSTFRVLLPPLASIESLERPDERAIRIASSSARVLIIDDDTLVLASLRRVLMGNDVTITRSAVEALQLVRKSAYDVVICDLMMPEMTGIEFDAQLALVAPEQRERVLFMTGGAFTPSAKAFLEGLKRPYLEKPYTADRVRELFAAIRAETGPRLRQIA